MKSCVLPYMFTAIFSIVYPLFRISPQKQHFHATFQFVFTSIKNLCIDCDLDRVELHYGTLFISAALQIINIFGLSSNNTSNKFEVLPIFLFIK